jgi:hypothetical protein
MIGSLKKIFLIEQRNYKCSQGTIMDTQQKSKIDTTEQDDQEDGAAIEQAFQQMEVLYKSRCVQAPVGTNVTIREIKKEE